jgi:hypothetical protein
MISYLSQQNPRNIKPGLSSENYLIIRYYNPLNTCPGIQGVAGEM